MWNKVSLLLCNVETTSIAPVLHFRRMINPSTTNTTTSYNAKPGNGKAYHCCCDGVDAWTAVNMKNTSITHRTLEPVRVFTIHLPDRHARHGTTLYITNDTIPVSLIGGTCITSEKMSNEFSSVSYQHMVCSKNMETHFRTAQ